MAQFSNFHPDSFGTNFQIKKHETVRSFNKAGIIRES